MAEWWLSQLRVSEHCVERPTYSNVPSVAGHLEIWFYFPGKLRSQDIMQQEKPIFWFQMAVFMTLIRLILSLPYIIQKPNYSNIINIGIHLQIVQNYLEIFEVSCWKRIEEPFGSIVWNMTKHHIEWLKKRTSNIQWNKGRLTVLVASFEGTAFKKGYWRKSRRRGIRIERRCSKQKEEEG